MAILTIIPSLNTVGNSFISLLFPNQCLVCKEGEFFSQDPICLDRLRQFDAVMSVEIGGGNGLNAAMVAAETDLPLVDADAMGRAYPEAQMTSFAVAGSLMPRSSRNACASSGSSAAISFSISALRAVMAAFVPL